MFKILFLLLFYVALHAQTPSADSSLIDKIDLTFGIEAGGIKTQHHVEALQDFTFQGTAIDENIPFNIAPVFAIQAGLRGFDFDFYVFARNSFLNYGGDGSVRFKQGLTIINMHQELYDRGLALTYKLNPNWRAGIIYSIYTVNIDGREGGAGNYRKIDLGIRSEMMKLLIEYTYINANVNIPVSCIFTVFSQYGKTFAPLQIEFPDQAADIITHYYYFYGDPFQFTIEAGYTFRFPLTPLLRYEYFQVGSTYNFHSLSIMLKWDIPN